MKKLLIPLLAVAIATGTTKTANDYTEPSLVRCTVYTADEGSITASGDEVREGIIAGRKEWLGMTALLYDTDMNFIGFYEFKDCGGAKGLKNGTVIDVFREDKVDCREWVAQYGDHVYMQIVDAKG